MADPFDLLEIEPRFDLDLNALAERHRELSLALHPDRFAGKAATERRAALSRAIEVNAAKRSLTDPVTRAEALMARLGLAVGETREPPATPELLEAMMDRREALRAAAAAGDKAGVLSLSERVKAEERVELTKLGTMLEAALAGQPPQALEMARSLGALRYHRRFFDEAGAVLDQLD